MANRLKDGDSSVYIVEKIIEEEVTTQSVTDKLSELDVWFNEIQTDYQLKRTALAALQTEMSSAGLVATAVDAGP